MSLLVNLDFGYDARLSDMPPEKYAALREAFPAMDISEAQPTETYVTLPDYLATVDELERLVREFGIHPTVKKVRGLSYPAAFNPTQIPAPASAVQVTQVSVANGALLEINTLQLLENACTDEVQAFLKNGWRIVAVCPSNDQRRPDYILGRKEAV